MDVIYLNRLTPDWWNMRKVISDGNGSNNKYSNLDEWMNKNNRNDGSRSNFFTLFESTGYNGDQLFAMTIYERCY